MIDRPRTSSVFVPRSRRRGRRISFFPFALVAIAAAGLGLLAISWQPETTPVALPAGKSEPAAPVQVAAARPAKLYNPILDPGFALGPAPVLLGQNAPLDARFQSIQPQPAAPAFPAAPAARPVEMAARAEPKVAQPDPAGIAPSLPLPKLVEGVTLPAPRPSDLRAPAEPQQPRLAERPSMRRSKAAVALATPADGRSFFEKLFGATPSTGTALAYAAPEDDVVDRGRGRRLSPTLPSGPVSAQGTAVYDISARTVYMPNGERLEAHSGLGDKLDDPRFAHVRMKGVTPPHTYTLTEREALFHGVRALRLNPVGGSGAIHGRAGLLAHTYLLGPNGDSNGCVSFKDYDKFLQAYLRGEVKRLVVVASAS